MVVFFLDDPIVFVFFAVDVTVDACDAAEVAKDDEVDAAAAAGVGEGERDRLREDERVDALAEEVAEAGTVVVAAVDFLADADDANEDDEAAVFDRLMIV